MATSSSPQAQPQPQTHSQPRSSDLEKQASGTTDQSSAEDEEREHVPDLQPRATSFAPMAAPNYRGEGQEPRMTRTFSRREPNLSHHDSHLFGGDIQRVETELHLQRFQSQQGKDLVTVHWEGDDDPENPLNWKFAYRWYLTVVAGLLVLNSTFTSSAPSGIIEQMIAEFGFSIEVATLVVALFVAGYCFGPIIWGPMSERVGRRPVLLIAMFIYTGMNVGCALSPNTASILIFRFLGGTAASAPLVASGGVIADIHNSKTRGDALALFSVAPFAGPALGPIVSGFIGVSGTSWRWLFWVCTIFSGACLILTALTLPETYAPIILKKKAARVRKETNDERYKAPLDLVKLDASTLLRSTLAKPFIMLAQEPMLLALTIYMAFVYGVLYLLFEAYPIVFQQGHGFNAGISGLMFLAFFLGGVVAVIIFMTVFNPRYARLVDQQPKGQRVPPEERLLPVMVAAPSFAIAFFWFAWTSYPSISYWAPMMAGSVMGLSLLFIFVGLFNFLVDAYLANAASALAGNTVVRSAFGAGFPLFARQMYNKLGTQWASTLLGFIALLLLPIPFVLYKYGARVRAWSKHAAE